MTKKTEDGLAAALAKAKVVRAKLSTDTDALNQRIKSFEKALSSLGLGVTASLNIDQDEHGEQGIDLRFQKWGDGWHLLKVHWAVFREDDDFDLLVNASRSLRLKAIESFPALVEKLVESAEEECARVAQATEKIDAAIAAVAEAKS